MTNYADLIQDAALASEAFGDDELERWQAEQEAVAATPAPPPDPDNGYPQTKEDAQKRRYGQRAGNERGTAYNPNASARPLSTAPPSGLSKRLDLSTSGRDAESSLSQHIPKYPNHTRTKGLVAT